MIDSSLGRLDPTRTPDPPAPERGRRLELAGVRRVVVKLGTRVLVDESGRVRRHRLEALAESVEALRRAGREVIVVSSGAVGLGRGLLGLAEVPPDAEGRRACAAVGQAALQALYHDVFSDRGIVTAQVLLTGHDFARRRLPTVWATFERLLAAGVVLVVNENDAVTHGANGVRTVFRDNDGLAAQVAAGCHADLLALLTDVAGVYDGDPAGRSDALPLERVAAPEEVLAGLASPPRGGVSRGGMRSKVAAAAFAARGGCHVVIASGSEAGVLDRLVAGEPVGTFFAASFASEAAP